MKIRFDYVTNSSSTSFVIISKGKPTKNMFLKAMGVKKGSLLESFGEELFGALSSNIDNAHDGIKSLLKKRIRHPSIAKRVVNALDAGMEVYIGTLRSDGYPTESFLCTESLEIDSPKLYVNALECTW